MSKKITIGTFQCSDQDVEFVTKAMKSNMISTGPELIEFERRCAGLFSKQHCIMVNSGQSALEIALVLAKQKLEKDRLTVALPATTYAATLWAILNTDCVPVFVDVNTDFNIDYPLLERTDF